MEVKELWTTSVMLRLELYEDIVKYLRALPNSEPRMKHYVAIAENLIALIEESVEECKKLDKDFFNIGKPKEDLDNLTDVKLLVKEIKIEMEDTHV